jgi:hypothetical protein
MLPQLSKIRKFRLEILALGPYLGLVLGSSFQGLVSAGSMTPGSLVSNFATAIYASLVIALPIGIFIRAFYLIFKGERRAESWLALILLSPSVGCNFTCSSTGSTMD